MHQEATQDFSGSAATTNPSQEGATTLGPAEYIRFLEMLERQMPGSPRAYLVTILDGKRHLTPVSDRCSVLDLSSMKELGDHLNNRPITSELLKHLLGYCQSRLTERGVDSRSEAVRSAGALIRECGELADSIQHITHDAIKDEAAQDETLRVRNQLRAIDQLSALLGFQADRCLSLLESDQVRGDETEWLSPGAYFGGENA
jgi:hypothetical protein